jgi:hypothetical protein
MWLCLRIVASLQQSSPNLGSVSDTSLLALVNYVILLWSLLNSAYSADDTFDQFTPMRMKFSGQSALSVITEITNSWKNGQGRFFPGAVTIGVVSHYFFLIGSLQNSPAIDGAARNHVVRLFCRMSHRQHLYWCTSQRDFMRPPIIWRSVLSHGSVFNSATIVHLAVFLNHQSYFLD